MAIDQQKIDLWFSSPPRLSPEQWQRMEQIRQAALQLSTIIIHSTPPCADQSHAVRGIRESVDMCEQAMRYG